MPNTLRRFYVILITQTFSMLGSQMTGYGIAVYLFIETGDVTPLAGVTFFGNLARVVATGFAGVWADRYDRRLMMVVSDFGQAIGTAVLLSAFWLDSLVLGLIFAVTFLQGIFGALQSPAFTASITLMVPDEKRDIANGMIQLSGAVSQVFSLVLAGVFYGLVGLGGIILIDLITFIAAMIVIFTSHIPSPPRTETETKEPMLTQLGFGFRYLWQHKPILQFAVAAMLANFFLLMSAVLFTPYLLILSDNDTALTGLVQGIGTAGGIVGALSIGFWQHIRPRMKVVVVSLGLEGVLLTMLGLVHSPALFAVVLFIFVIQFPVVNTMFMSIMQQKVPADMQGRVFSAIMQLAMLIQPIAALLAGPLADDVFQPAVNRAWWDNITWLVGDGDGAGIRLMIILNGMLMTVLVGGIMIRPAVRHLEANMPDPIPPTAAIPAAA